MSEIPTRPSDDQAETIMSAVAHGMTGNPLLGMSLLAPFLQRGAVSTVSMCAALASIAVFAAEKENPGARGTFGIIAFHGNAPTDIQAMPPGPRFAAQFTAAWANGQTQTAYALFNALLGNETDQDAENLVDGIETLYGMAVSSAQQMRGGGR